MTTTQRKAIASELEYICQHLVERIAETHHNRFGGEWQVREGLESALNFIERRLKNHQSRIHN